MKWYIAKIVFRIVATSSSVNNQFDEHLRLVEARSTEEAVLKARIIGLREEDSFCDSRHYKARWEFVNVATVHPVELVDGAELHSTIQTQEASEEYIHDVHLRAIALQTECRFAAV